MTITRILGTALIACGLLATSACNTMKKTTTPAAETTATPRPVATKTPSSQAIKLDALLGEWSITEAESTAIVVNGENHPKITLALVAGHPDMLRVIGFNGCNYINGDWQINGNNIRNAGEFISSLRACPDAPYESTVNLALNSVASYRLTDADNLELISSTGKVVMKLRSRNLSFLNGAWKVTAIHGTAVPESADVRVVIDIDECKIHGNAGCNVLNGEIVVNLDKGDGIEFKNLATSRMMCPDIATEQAFLLALEEVDTAVRGTEPQIALLKDTQGNTVITLSRLSPDELTEE